MAPVLARVAAATTGRRGGRGAPPSMRARGNGVESPSRSRREAARIARRSQLSDRATFGRLLSAERFEPIGLSRDFEQAVTAARQVRLGRAPAGRSGVGCHRTATVNPRRRGGTRTSTPPTPRSSPIGEPARTASRLRLASTTRLDPKGAHRRAPAHRFTQLDGRLPTRRTRRLPRGADLYGSDATLFAAHGDVRVNVGADLWASDAALYADVMTDRARSRAEALKDSLRARAVTRRRVQSRAREGEDGGGGVEAEDEDDGAVCPVCLGGISARDGEDEGDGAEDGADHGVNPDVNSDDDDGGDSLIAELPCGHRLHLRCALAAVDACVGAGDPPRCPTCRRVAAADGFLAC